MVGRRCRIVVATGERHENKLVEQNWLNNKLINCKSLASQAQRFQVEKAHRAEDQ